MKKLIVAIAVCLMFGLSCAYAEDPGADLYKSKCAKCHGADGAKTTGASGGVVLKGQSAEDIKTKLMGYKDGSYGGDKKKTMIRLVDKLEDAQIAELAEHIGGL